MRHLIKLYLSIMASVSSALRYAWTTRRAWWFTATARTRDRFASTVLGSFWLGLSTLLSLAVLAVVYGTVFKVQDFRNYVVYLGTGLVIWNSLSASIHSATTLLAHNSVKLKSTNINPIFFTFEEWGFQVQAFLQSFGLVLLALLPFRFEMLGNLLTVGLLPLVNLLLFMYWFPLLVCLLGARYQDLYQVVPTLTQFLFVLSPILYSKENLGRFSWTAEINPLYRVLSGFRHALTEGDLQLQQVAVGLLINAMGIILAIALLERQRKDWPFLA